MNETEMTKHETRLKCIVVDDESIAIEGIVAHI